MKKTILALSAFGLLAGTSPALASQCRDAHGKFVKCPQKAKQCRDAKGHFTKCK